MTQDKKTCATCAEFYAQQNLCFHPMNANFHGPSGASCKSTTQEASCALYSRLKNAPQEKRGTHR